MFIKDIWKVITDYGTATLADKLSSTAVAYLPNSFYVKVRGFLETLDNKNDSSELTLGEAYEFVKCVFTTERDKLYEIEKKLHDDIFRMIPYNWSAAARILLKDGMMREDIWLLCSQNGNRGLSYLEILLALQALCAMDKCVIDFLQKSSFFFDAVTQTAGLTKDNLRQSLLTHRNTFCLVLFTYKTQGILEEVLKQPDAENKILTQMLSRINAMEPGKYEALCRWNSEDLQDFAFQAPRGSGMFQVQLATISREITPQSARLGV